MIDIIRTANDTYYRYKMPRAIVKYEGKPGNTKTFVTNLDEIAASLNRMPMHILKFVSYELATRTDVTAGRYAITGKYDASRVQELIYAYIDAFVVCLLCNNPETFYVENSGLMMECFACGRQSVLKTSKLSGMILKDIDKSCSVNDDIYSGATEDKQDSYEEQVRTMIGSGDDRSSDAIELLRINGFDDCQAVKELLKMDKYILKSFQSLCSCVAPKTILQSIEEFVEELSGEKMIIQEYLRILETQGMFKRTELSKYFTRPQGTRKRSPAFKKEVNEYFSSQ
ncbi:subunit beta of translation initiation factor IF-2 [Ordospora colligata]|uniref:Subunit beta of translation initiation factor IF-2 n=1 Tax=Ordospora colligata OC4 TaxID=1354746 RepID=A0A0B2UJI8_9MICR|nr:subunit beta of translation initiation factor IF-2 [Ordospora colligata OC4]KHN69394.1 subunit beta of translation initiation factor IF-2 [Ordospora colligata OC4]TBU14908.1 subunit beta of translation initiation factor IF-2 [Ordospora colligata]TBU18293.1 subunit beta of translation initiation factor IF-2 [Ordospora colligata]